MYVAIILCWKFSTDSCFTSSTRELLATSDRVGRIFPPIVFQVGSRVTRYTFVWNDGDALNVSSKTEHNPSLVSGPLRQ